MGEEAKELFHTVATQLASMTVAQVCFVSSGSPAEDDFARACAEGEADVGDVAMSWNLLPVPSAASGGEPSSPSAVAASVASGRLLRAGRDPEERRQILLMLGDIYICFGGSDMHRAEARVLYERGALLLPLVAAGMGDVCPSQVRHQKPAIAEEADWELLLANSYARAQDVAAAVAAIVGVHAAGVQALSAEDVMIVAGCSPSDLNGTYVRSGLHAGRKRFIHSSEPEQGLFFEDGRWCLSLGGFRVYENGSGDLGPPSSGWDLLGKPPRGVTDSDAKNGNRRSCSGLPGSAGRRSSASLIRRTSVTMTAPPVPIPPPKPKAPSCLSKTRGSRLAELIQHGCIALLKCSYLEDCLYNKMPLMSRQKIPSMQIWNSDEAIKKWMKHGKCFFVAVSYPWLSKTHPDPESFHLRTLVGILGAYKMLWGMQEVAVFLDYCSLWRRDARSAEMQEQLAEALSEMSTIYAHKAITTIQLTSVPDGEPRLYEDRGWTLFESVMISSKNGDWNRWAISGFDDDTPIDDPYMYFDGLRPDVRLLPPMSAKRFARELRARGRVAEERGSFLFADPRDSEFIHTRYMEGLRHICRKPELSYCDAGWGDVQVEMLCEVLPESEALERLLLSGNRIKSQGVSMLLRVLPKLKSLQLLVLTGNPLCQNGADRDRLRVAWELDQRPATGLVM